MSESKLSDTSTPFEGWSQANDLTLVTVSETEVIAELRISSKHHQPMGIVHGGVYCGIVETVCSVGGYAHASKRGNFVVGVDNHTSFLKATRSGTLRAVARPLSVGRRTQLWEADVRDESGALVATGRVRLISVEAGANLAGAPAGNLAG
jgi:1,4-dihydroxy-2-naphthoyl-CoA hydrolase